LTFCNLIMDFLNEELFDYFLSSLSTMVFIPCSTFGNFSVFCLCVCVLYEGLSPGSHKMLGKYSTTLAISPVPVRFSVSDSFSAPSWTPKMCVMVFCMFCKLLYSFSFFFLYTRKWSRWLMLYYVYLTISLKKCLVHLYSGIQCSNKEKDS
jgi:hypothetical protein